MKLFRKKEETSSCCSGGNCTPEAVQEAEILKKENGIKILGSGCAKCVALENATKMAVSELGLDYVIQHITDFTQIACYGVMTTPALVFDGKVLSYGKVLSVDEIKEMLQKELTK